MAFSGCLIKPNADATFDLDPVVAFAFDGADVYDTDGFHDPSSNNTKIIIPSAINGYWVTLKAGLTTTSQAADGTIYGTFLKNGSSSFYGFGGLTRNTGASANGTTTTAFSYICSTPIQVTTGDEFEVQWFDSDASVTVVAAQTWFSLQVINSSLSPVRGVLAKKAADQTSANYSTAAVIAWPGTDEYDTDAAHDPSSNNTKIIVPSAWNNMYGVLKCCVYMTSITSNGTTTLSILRGASQSYSGFVGLNKNFGAPGTQCMSVVESPPLLLATAQEFEAQLHCVDTSITIEFERSAFGLWVVGS